MTVKARRASAKAAKAKATALHSKIVRARGACECCGKTLSLQCAHIVSRRYARTRTRLDNAFCLCAGCHMHFTEWPMEFAEFVVNRIGAEKYAELRTDAHGTSKVDWADEVTRLEAVWNEIERAA